jgi:uncharacterized membrane protein YqiK
MIKKNFNFYILISTILVGIIVILMIIGMKNFYKSNTKKEILLQKTTVSLKDNEDENQKF